MDGDGSSSGRLSPKEFARLRRHQAYQRAKEQRAKDPKHLAVKEAVKERRRQIYQQVKEQRKIGLAEQKKQAKTAEREKRSQERATKDGELLKMLSPLTEHARPWLSKGSTADN